MTLTTHALVGAAAASLFPEQPLLGFAAAFASHLTIDSLPHWDYKILSKQDDASNKLNEDMKIGRFFFYDLVRIGNDILLGLVLSWLVFCVWIFHMPILIVLMGACAGILPDPLQFVYFKTRSKILEPLQRFHIWVQKGKSIHPPAWLGLTYQAVLVLFIIVILRAIVA